MEVDEGLEVDEELEVEGGQVALLTGRDGLCADYVHTDILVLPIVTHAVSAAHDQRLKGFQLFHHVTSTIAHGRLPAV